MMTDNERPPLGMPRLPRLPRIRSSKTSGRASKPRMSGPAVNDLDPADKGWGGPMWWQARPGDTAVGGTCQKCGGKTRAIDLRLHRQKDGSDIWKCPECGGRNRVKQAKTDLGEASDE